MLFKNGIREKDFSFCSSTQQMLPQDKLKIFIPKRRMLALQETQAIYRKSVSLDPIINKTNIIWG